MKRRSNRSERMGNAPHTHRDMTDLLTDVFDALTEGIAIFDEDARLVACNRRYREMFEPVAEMIEPGMAWRAFNLACLRRGVFAGRRGSESEIIARADEDLASRRQGGVIDHSDGRSFEVSYNATGSGGFVITRTEVTERRRNDALVRFVVEACPAPILMIRADTGEILFRSPQATELFGDKDNTHDFYVTAADRDGFIGEIRRHREVSEYRLRLRNAQGEACWCAVSARLIQWDGDDVIVSHSRDLTGQLSVEAELQRQREQLFQNEKMTALGGLLAGVAHELNNPLSVVVGHAMMLADETRDQDVLRQATKIGNAAERCARIVRTFLSMARQDPMRMAATDLGTIVETVAEVARYGYPGREVRIVTDLADEMPLVRADADQLTQAVVNLVLNAEQAIGAAELGDTVRISARSARNGRRVQILVEDNGPGIPADIRARVFEPFFTTKGVGQGTGIGLAMCHQVVTAHNGTISIEDVDPHGARFTISLPAATGAESSTAEMPAAGDEHRAIRVLVIDDEADVADLNAEILARGGYKAEAAYTAAQAFALLRNGAFDVVLSDLNMPETDGREVFDVIRAEFPDLARRTGFVTGDTMGKASQGFLSEAGRPYIEKPVSPKELRAFVALLSAEGSPR